MIDLDPRTRIVIVFFISSAAIILKEIKSLLLLLTLTLAICMLLSISLKKATMRLKRLWYVFIVLALVQSIFTHGGEPLLALGGIEILTTKGLETGISIILRMSIIIYSALIILITSPMDMVYGLAAMKMPQEIGFMVLLAIKFLPLIKEEFIDSIIAVQLAGADLKRIPLGKKISLYTYILTPSVIKALRRARFISLSMECRGFRAYSTRTYYRKLNMKKGDYAIIVVTLIFLIAIVSTSW
ncbi:MAG: energy-coupling factor transporter transmembrane protein EcfT [Clostridiales bacterium]|nr:energy-coupling factor transporter transmembrane protein EcfT [Clostridiales bacterium]